MKKLEEFTIYLIPILILSSILGLFLEIKITISVSLTAILFIAYMIYKEKIGQELIVAFLIAIGLTSYYYYEYTSLNILLGRINLFPLIAFTFGLVLLREIYEKIQTNHKFLLSIVIYLFGIALVEFVGYYILGIRINGNYPSLLNLGIIHAPLEIKILYVLIGPIYLLITDYLKIK